MPQKKNDRPYSWTQTSWPKDLDPEKSPYPRWMVESANSNRWRARFWMSPVGLLTLVVLGVVGYILAAIFE